MKKRKKSLSTSTLLAQYRDPLKSGSLGGLTRFAKANKITVKLAREVPERDLGYTLHKPRRRRFPTAQVVVFGIDKQWTADLMEVINIAKYNRGYHYLLTVVDVFLKHAWVQPVKYKTGRAVTEAFEKILRKGGSKLINLQTDDGKEIQQDVSGMMKRKDITILPLAGIPMEWFNQTLKQRLYRYFTVKNMLNFVPILQDLGQGDKRSYHHSIKRAPNEVTQANSSDVCNTLYGKKTKSKWKKP